VIVARSEVEGCAPKNRLFLNTAFVIDIVDSQSRRVGLQVHIVPIGTFAAAGREIEHELRRCGLDGVKLQRSCAGAEVVDWSVRSYAARVRACVPAD
jgi:hypothetical protein